LAAVIGRECAEHFGQPPTDRQDPVEHHHLRKLTSAFWAITSVGNSGNEQ
jgi:hypothetical protein